VDCHGRDVDSVDLGDGALSVRFTWSDLCSVDAEMRYWNLWTHMQARRTHARDGVDAIEIVPWSGMRKMVAGLHAQREPRARREVRPGDGQSDGHG
jgi:hypothetical protein